MIYTSTKPGIGTQIDWADPLSQGLVGCWLFNEGGGSPTELVSNRTSSIGGTLSASAIGVNGQNYYVNTLGKRLTPVTLISKFRRNNYTSGLSHICGITNAAATTGIGFSISTTGILQVNIPGQGASTFSTLTVPVSSTAFIAIVQKPSVSIIGYLGLGANFKSVTNASINQGTTTGQMYYYGAGADDSLLCNSELICTFIYNRSLNATEIQRLHEMTKGW